METENIEFSRKTDLENLNKIPVIWNMLAEVKEDVKEIKRNFADYPEIKSDVKWISKFFWLIAGSSISAVILALFGLILKR